MLRRILLPVFLLFAAAMPGQAWIPFRPIPSSVKAQGNTQTGIPVICISTGGEEVLSNKNYVDCTVDIYNVAGKKALRHATGGIRLRGNSSRYMGDWERIRLNPVPYRLKFDNKVNLLGLNGGAECKSWILLTNLSKEKDVIKNDIALRMGRMIMEPDNIYCSDAQLAHLYLNGVFRGTYLVCEQNQVNKHRVKVSEPKKDETGTNVGYFLEIDRHGEAPNFWMDYGGGEASDVAGTVRKYNANVYAIKSDTFSKEQVDFIANYTRGVFNIVFQACEKGNYLTFDEEYNVVPSTFTGAKECVDAVMDLKSVVDMYVLSEIMCDNDLGESSFFMCVDFSKDSEYPKLTFTAPWDYNWSVQSRSTGSLHAAVFRMGSFTTRYGDRSNPWFIVLYKQPWFREMVREKWNSFGGKEGVRRCIALENTYISLYGQDLFRRDEELKEDTGKVLNWIQKRADWLDRVWNGPEGANGIVLP